MIYFDVTKTGTAGHRSGLMRVSGRLRDELGEEVVSVVWRERMWRRASDGTIISLKSADWVFSAELFSEEERPGFWEFIQGRSCRLAAVFHDAIPLKLPHITWPRSVARHAEYMKMLAAFDRVFAVSQVSGVDLTEFWRWQGTVVHATVETILWGADFQRGSQRRASPVPAGQVPALLCVGIIEPRKNQAFLLEVCAALWASGLIFELHIVGRVNPHFGKPVQRQMRELAKKWPGLRIHDAIPDDQLFNLYGRASATVFPTIAEGCGLPLLESLWLGVPCVCSDLPVLMENAGGGGCVPVAMNDRAAWQTVLARVVTDAAWVDELRGQAAARVVPGWVQTADFLRRSLAS
jgi:glycosyltransferase involved in cell wall biosynthesis